MCNLIYLIILICIIICTITDIKTKKILNICTFPLMLIGIIYNINQKGLLHGFLFSFTSSLEILLLIFVISLIIQGFGFGDVKLFMGLASCIGFKLTLAIYIISLVLFIIWSIICNRKESMKKIFSSFFYIKTIVLFGKNENYEIPVNETKAFSVFILIAYILFLIKNIWL